jgi:four helix bundle protein
LIVAPNLYLSPTGGGGLRDFRELKVWQLSHLLALQVYKATSAFPREEMYGLTAQLRRASVSVLANIAEGSGRHSNAGMRQFLVISHGSATEVQCLLIIAGDLGYISLSAKDRLYSEFADLRRMLNGFIRRLKPVREAKG